MAFRIKDDRNRDLIIGCPPKRVVSLVPSDTYTLFSLGLGNRVVGRSEYCVEPSEGIGAIPTCGGTKNIDIRKVASLEPDIIFCNQEENARAPLMELAQMGFKVFCSFQRSVGESINHVARMARIFSVTKEPQVVSLVKRGYENLRRLEQKDGRIISVFVPIWMDPLMTFGADTYGNSILELCNGRNIFEDRKRLYPLAADLGNSKPFSDDKVGQRDTRYPRISAEEKIGRKPEVVLLPDEPHPFTSDDQAFFLAQATPAAQNGNVDFCDGKDLFWHGAWSIDAIERVWDLLSRYR